MKVASILALIVACSMVACGAELKVGTAAVEITPPVGWRMAGNYYERVSTGIHDPLYAKAMIFDQGRTRFALVVADVCSVGRVVTDPARDEASQRTGIPRDNIVICATHTHAGPEYYGVLRDLFHKRAVEKSGRDEREPIDYQAFFIEACVKAISQAVANGQPARASVGVARQPAVAHNRRYVMRDGTVRFNPPRQSPDIVRVAGPVDEDFPVLLFRDADDTPMASVSVFAMHVATFGGTEYGADYPGVLQSRLRDELGDRFFSVFAQGTAGDINHLPFLSDTPTPTTAFIGNTLAQTFIQHLPKLVRIVEPSLATCRKVVLVPLKTITPEEVQRAEAVLNRDWVPDPDFLVLVDAWRTLNTRHLRQRDGDNLLAEVQALRLDDQTAIVTMPHEIFVELGLSIKQRSPFKYTFVISMANDLDFYVPTRRAFAEGSYEVVTSSIRPGGGELLVDAAVELLVELKQPKSR